MKHFIYTYAEKVSKGHLTKSVRIYRIKSGIPTFVAEGTDTFVSEFQLVLGIMQTGKLLPRRAFASNNFGGYRYTSYELEEEGIATIRRIS